MLAVQLSVVPVLSMLPVLSVLGVQVEDSSLYTSAWRGRREKWVCSIVKQSASTPADATVTLTHVDSMKLVADAEAPRVWAGGAKRSMNWSIQGAFSAISHSIDGAFTSILHSTDGAFTCISHSI